MSSLRSIKKGPKPLTDGEIAELARVVTLDHQSKEARQLALMVLLDEIEQVSQISAAKLDPANEAGRAAFAVTDYADQARQRLIAAVRKDHNTGDEPLLEIIQSFAVRSLHSGNYIAPATRTPELQLQPGTACCIDCGSLLNMVDDSISGEWLRQHNGHTIRFRVKGGDA